MKLKGNFFVALVLLFVLGVSPLYAAGKITIRMTHETSKTGDLQQVFEAFAKELEKRMPGRFDVRIFPLGQLFSDKESFDQIRMGNVEIGGGTFGTLAAVIDPRLSVVDLPFLFSSFDAMRAVSKSEMGQEIQKIIEAKDLKLLGVGRSTRLGLITKKAAVRSPDDLKGKLIRGFSPTVQKPMLEAWGGRYTYLAAPELAHAMETGIIDGIWTSVLGWVMSGREPGNFMTVFPPHAALMYKVCSAGWWKRLPEDVKKVIEESMEGALDLNWKVISPDYEKENLDKYPCGQGKYQACYLTAEEAKVWKSQSKVIYQQLAPVFGEKLTDLALKLSMSSQ